MSITGGLQAEAMALWPPKPMSPKHDEVPRGGGEDRERLCPPRDQAWGSRCPSSPGTSTRRPLLLPQPHFLARDHRWEGQTGRYETGWRLNRKWEWGFLRRRQIINLLINSRGLAGEEGAVPLQC